MSLSEDEKPARSRKGNDNHPWSRRGAIGDDLVMGLRFFTRLPTGDRPHEPPSLNRITLALPFVSLVVGIVPAILVALLAYFGVPAYFAAAIGVAIVVVVTGGMAEDGLADAFDGLFGGADRERRLQILKDSRHGTYGVVALCLFLVMRVTAVGGAAAVNPLAGAAMWLGAMVVARSACIWLAVSLPAARLDGASASVGRVTAANFLVGMVLAVVIGFLLAAPAAHIAGYGLGLLLCAGMVSLWVLTCQRLVGGQTGDLIGALQALCEVAVLLGFLIFA